MKLSNESVVVELKNSTVVQVRKSESCAGFFKKALEGWKNGGISRGYQGIFLIHGIWMKFMMEYFSD
jgi:hypothetical protein